jgi:Di-haem oxidoreductase, putative peroxidase
MQSQIMGAVVRSVVLTSCAFLAQQIGQVASPGPPGRFQQVHQTSLPHNADACADCHSIPIVGGSSGITALRAGERTGGRYKGAGESGILHAHNEYDVHIETLITGRRVALNLLGDAYVEAIPDRELEAIATHEVEETHGAIHGQCAYVTLPEAENGEKPVGKFGWKAQHASLYSASAEALYGELGVPNPYFPVVTSSKAPYQTRNDARSDSTELDLLVHFLRSTEPM